MFSVFSASSRISVYPELIDERLGDDVDLVINGGAGGFEYSTVVYCVDGDQEIIRQGKGVLDE